MSSRVRSLDNASASDAPCSAEQSRQGAEVLVLDDDSTLLTLLEEALTAAGFRCIVAKSPTAALRLCGEYSSIKVIVSDVFMPHMNGLEFVSALRSAKEQASTPQVLFLTGHPSMQTAIDALRLGATDFLTKPVRPKELIDAVQRALGRARMSQPASYSLPAHEIAQLANQATALAERLRQIASPTRTLSAAAAPHQEPTIPDTSLLELIGVFRELQSQLSDSKLDDVAWDLLLELARSKLQEQTLSVSDLMVLQGYASSTTILRRINRLEELGFVQKLKDPTDGRRDFVLMTPLGSELVEQFLLQAKRHVEDAMLAF